MPPPGWSTRSGAPAFEAEGAAFREPLSPDADLAAARRQQRCRRAGAGRAARRRRRAATGAPALAGFVAETDRVLDLFAGFMPEVRALDDAETLTYLHGTISTRRASGRGARDADVSRRAARRHAADRRARAACSATCICARSPCSAFPNVSRPGILDALNHQDFGYRWVTRFIALDKTDATKALTRLRRQWFNKRKSVTALLREVHVQPARPAARQRRRQQGRRCRPRAAGARRRPCRVRLSDHDDHGHRRRSRARPTTRSARSSGSSTASASPRIREERQRGRGLAVVAARPGLRQCPPAAGPHAQSRASDAAVGGLGGPGAQRAISTDRRCSTRRPAARRRSGSRPMSAMSATCWSSGRPAPASRCCWR